MRAQTLATVLAIVYSLAASGASAATRRYAVVVAHNQSLLGNAAPLEYADDDGARYFELFQYLADEVRLFSVLDAKSQQIYPQVARHARVPRRKDVLRGIRQVFAAAKKDIDRGDQVVFYLVVIGHGEIGPGGEGYVSLLDAPFTRSDLYREVLAKSPATANHVIIDACNAYHLVHRRGKGRDDRAPSQRAAVEAFLSAEEIDRYPNTGLLLSTSAAKESHEWSRYSAGVFSHQLRSAMLGAADVNGDGKIEYSEVQAFVAAANTRVANAAARVDMFAKAPAIDLARPLVDLTESSFRHWLGIRPEGPLRLYLEDERGVRYLDAHLANQNVVLALLPGRDYYVRDPRRAHEALIRTHKPGRVDLRAGMMGPQRMSSRGAVAESFRQHLFEEPYGSAFYTGFVLNSSTVPVAPPAQRFWPRAVPMDREGIEVELARLERLARRKPRLKKRLRTVVPAVLRFLHDDQLVRAASALRKAERSE